MAKKKTSKKTTTRRATKKSKPKAGGELAEPKTAQRDPAAYQVLQWLLEGHDERQIAEALGEQFPQADHAQAFSLAMQHLADVATADPAVIRGWALEALRHIYQKAIAIDDLGAAVRAIKELTRLADGNP